MFLLLGLSWQQQKQAEHIECFSLSLTSGNAHDSLVSLSGSPQDSWYGNSPGWKPTSHSHQINRCSTPEPLLAAAVTAN